MTFDERLRTIADLTQQALADPIRNAYDGWAMADDALALIEKLVTTLHPSIVMEMGSGRSTCALARAATSYLPRPRVLSFDHDPECAARSRAWLAEVDASDLAEVAVAPIVLRKFESDGRLLPVYEIDPAVVDADLVVVDGPPALLGGREGSIRQALASCKPGGLVVVDDASRPDEQRVLEGLERNLRPHVYVHRAVGFERGMALLFVGKRIDDGIRRGL